MKKLTMLILTVLLFASCAHHQPGAAGTDVKSECTSCKTAAAAAAKVSEPDCACCKK